MLLLRLVSLLHLILAVRPIGCIRLLLLLIIVLRFTQSGGSLASRLVLLVLLVLAQVLHELLSQCVLLPVGDELLCFLLSLWSHDGYVLFLDINISSWLWL